MILFADVGDPLPEDLQGLFPADGVPAAGLLDPLGESGTTEESAFAPSSTQSSRDKPRHLTSSSSFSRAPVELQHSVSAPNLPSGASPCARAVNEPSGGTMSADFSISNDHSRSYNNYNNNSSGVMYSTGYDAPTPRAVSPALPTTPGVSEGSNGHHCITCAGALDGHMLEDYVCQLDQRPHLHLRGDEESSCTDSPVPAMQPSPTANVTNVTNNSSMTSSQRSRSGRIPLSPTKESSLKKEGKSTPTSGDKDRDKKAKKAQFVSSEAAAAKEIMTLFMG